MIRIMRWLAAAVVLAGASPALAQAPVEAFIEQADVRAGELSPDGTKMAFIARVDDGDQLAILDIASGAVKPLLKAPNVRARDVMFAGNDYVVLFVSTTSRFGGFGRHHHEFGGYYAYNLKTGRSVNLLKDTDGMTPSTGSRIVAVDPGGQHVYMAVAMGMSSVTLDILRVNLDSGRGSRVGGQQGRNTTANWLLDAQGKPIIREDYDGDTKEHSFTAFDGAGKERKIYSRKGENPELAIVGVSGKTGALLAMEAKDSLTGAVYDMDLATGKLGEPLEFKTDAEVQAPLADAGGVVRGVMFSGMQPSYEMFDASVQQDIDRTLAAFPSSSVYIDSWSADWSKVLIYVSGGAARERYMLLDRNTKKLSALINARSRISQADVGEVASIQYKARDGLEIPAIVTWPAGSTAEQRKNLPLVVLPHGGPQAYDQIGFDWLAQFLANQGYLVLQPNFRGSAGFGPEFTAAGRREWGRKMQHDVSDGVLAMIRMGWADKERVCIMGWSYGGYAALAGGALTPELYKCVVSVAGVSDLMEMLAWEKSRYGEDGGAYKYWKMVIGDPQEDRAAIEAVSPARKAADFRAPVLLVHGTEDTIVPASQSDRMNNALKAAGKEVSYVKVRGDDHSLVENESRRDALTAAATFLAKHLKGQ